jgi:RNase P subunit RPR2
MIMNATVTIIDQSARITYTQELVTETCISCGVPFAFPKSLQAECLRDHEKRFYCPNGHNMVYSGKTAEQRQRERADAAIRRAEMAERSLRASRETSLMHKRQAAAYKGQLTKARKRLGAGVCPVTDCHRTVRQLADHMAAKHPDYAAEPVTEQG